MFLAFGFGGMNVRAVLLSVWRGIIISCRAGLLFVSGASCVMSGLGLSQRVKTSHDFTPGKGETRRTARGREV